MATRRIAAALDVWLPTGVTVTGYHALGDEPGLDSIVDDRRRWLAPRVEGDSMTFHDWAAPTETIPFGLQQPTGQAPVVPAGEIDVMVIPGLAFDRSGVRLGRGGGYFDRFLAAHPEVVETIGVCPVARLVEVLPRQPHDAAVRWIVTEAGVAPTASR